MNLLGTPGNDTFSFSPGAAADTWIISLDGVTQTVVGSSVQVTFNGLGGTDTAVVHGSGSGQQAALRPQSADISGADYSVHVVAESITVDAGSGGSGQVTFSGVAGKTDYFTATQTSAIMSNSSSGKWTTYYNCAKNFTTVVANSAPGGQDRASLYGTPTSVFNAYATYAQFGRIEVNNFRYVTAYGGGAAAANLYAGAATDTLVSNPTQVNHDRRQLHQPGGRLRASAGLWHQRCEEQGTVDRPGPRLRHYAGAREPQQQSGPRGRRVLRRSGIRLSRLSRYVAPSGSRFLRYDGVALATLRY